MIDAAIADVAVPRLTGALTASRAQLDIIGFFFLASLTGIGGGTIGRSLAEAGLSVLFVEKGPDLGDTAVAALESGVITPSTTILDRGIYDYYSSPQPRCWIYSSYGSTHGRVNVSEAITVSCNYFFYEVDRKSVV